MGPFGYRSWLLFGMLEGFLKAFGRVPLNWGLGFRVSGIGLFADFVVSSSNHKQV